jgi:hypothetical protein
VNQYALHVTFFENFRVIPRENISIGFRITGFLSCFHPQVKRWDGTYSDGTVRKTWSQSQNHFKQNTAIWKLGLFASSGERVERPTDHCSND